MSDTLERLRRLNKPASSIGGHLIPVDHEDLSALLDIAEAAREVLDYESRPRAAALTKLRSALAALDSTGGAER